MVIQETVVATWPEFLQIASTSFPGKWLFRGALNKWPLAPSLERAATDWKVPLSELPDIERRLLREFKRAYPPCPDVPAPAEDDDLAWLALMQHHGAPTRLLDWTYSVYVAAFFGLDALLSSADPDTQAAIWAFSIRPFEDAFAEPDVRILPTQALKEASRAYAKTREATAFWAVFREARILLAGPVGPYRLNERLIIQQGVFLCPGDITRPFEENLLAIPGIVDSGNSLKILLPRMVLSEAFQSLHRMNIGYATLFPGIDGFARSLRNRFDFLRTKQFYDLTKS